VRAVPALFMVPLETELGWSRAVISASIAVNIALFGLIGPFAASVMDRWGLRRVVLGALALTSTAVVLSTQMTAEWQFFLLWGVAVGGGTGVTAMVLGAIVSTRWFDARRGLVMGLLSAANATGQLIFLTPLAWVMEASSWRTAVLIVAASAMAVLVLVWLFMRDRPADIGLRPYGQASDAPQAPPPAARTPVRALAMVSRTRAFWRWPARSSSAVPAPTA
jgi:sugar phosphate permease